MSTALCTPLLNHLPFHPGSYFGYGSEVLRREHDGDVIDLNAAIYHRRRDELVGILGDMDKSPVVVDNVSLEPFYRNLSHQADAEIGGIRWADYEAVFITPPSWFPTVPTTEVLRLASGIRKQVPDMPINFFGNSLGSWTDENELIENGVQVRDLNDLFNGNPSSGPVDFDALPMPVYEDRHLYLFDMLPFRLKHGCNWGKCKFCSLAKGWNAGYLERSARRVIEEIEVLIDRYDPELFVCRDNAINGSNLADFCDGFSEFNKPWGGMARANLSQKEIEALERSGCEFIYFGLESGSDRVLERLDKGIDSKQMSWFIRALHDHGIIPAPSLIVGSPGESDDDFNQSIEFILDHRNCLKIINLYPYIPSPASEYSEKDEQPHEETLQRLQTMIGVCAASGLKVCVGEQSAEYASFRMVAALQHQ
jgi:hypothetical protein